MFFFRTVIICVLINTYSFQQNSKWNHNLLQFLITILRDLCQGLFVGICFNVKNFTVTNSLGYRVNIYIYNMNLLIYIYFKLYQTEQKKLLVSSFSSKILASLEPTPSIWAHKKHSVFMSAIHALTLILAGINCDGLK